MNHRTTAIDAAQEILRSLGLPPAQQNERSALCLLALLNLTPGKTWADAEKPLVGITPIMDWARKYYGKDYAPNTRETFRRQSMHQFCAAGLVLCNPDKPDRPVNSPRTVYQIEPATLNLLCKFGTSSWDDNLASYLAKRETLVVRYAKERKLDYPFFRREWELLERGANRNRYWKLTVVETFLPTIFFLLFFSFLVIALYIFCNF